MNQRIFALIGWMLIFALLAACGPSPEEIATMTASAWTPTPVPPTSTPVPTPIPIDLTVTITDEGGAPIEGASIVLPESGSDGPVLSDPQGMFSWTNLNGEKASLKASAQGYFPAEQSATLQHGPNEVNIALKRDPYAFLPSGACAAGETLLYSEDFQDGQTDIKHYADGPTQTPLGEAPDEAGNTVLVHDFTTPASDYSSWYNKNAAGERVEFGDAVWRMRFMISDETDWGVGWRDAGPNEFGGITTSQSSYGIYFNTGRHAGITRAIWDASGQPVPDSGLGFVDKVLILDPKVWHYLEISTYQGHIQVWLDGEFAVDAVDETLLPPGGFNIGKGNTGIMYFDAISVCGLSVPFAPMPSPIPAP